MSRIPVFAFVIALAIAPAALAAPQVTTDPAEAVTATTATLAGTVTPDVGDATCHFEYGTQVGPGPTYAQRTPDQGVAPKNNKKPADVRATVSGLTASTLYHFRLVCSTSGGVTAGADRTFTTTSTTAPPTDGARSIDINATPSVVVYGRSVVLSGKVQLPGKNQATTVTLLRNQFPYNGSRVIAQTTSDAGGQYSFTVKPARNTFYKVRITAQPTVMSRAVLVKVRSRVTFRTGASSVARGGTVRLSGLVFPRHDALSIRVERLAADGTFRLVKRVPLNANDSRSSSYSTRVRVFATRTFRMRLASHGDHIAGISVRRRITVS